MTKSVLPVLKAGGAIGAGALLVVIVAGAFQGGGAPQEQQAGPTMGAYQAPVDVDTAGLPGPVQPIFFRHDIHAGQYQLDCQYCHGYADISWNPGLPSTALCMGCHRVVGTTNPEVQKLSEAANNNTPIEWAEVHDLRQFVHFPHNRHVAVARIACQTCHGQVERMPQVWQFASLKMGWCLDCHTSSTYANDPDRPVTTDCTACHY